MIRKLRIAFVIPSLTTGGAERQLCNLAQHMDQARFELHVFVYYPHGQDANGSRWQELLTKAGVELHFLNKRPGAIGYLSALPRILELMFRVQPEILHGYLDGNLLALLLGGLFRRRVVWGIRRTSQDLSHFDVLSLRLLRVMISLSRYVDLVIFNSEAGRLNHARMGMRAPRMTLIPNGFDISQFFPDTVSRHSQRSQWGLLDQQPLIGIVARLDPTKDHPTFLRAAKRLSQDWPTAVFICIGGGQDAYAKSLLSIAEALGIANRVLWPGTCSHMPPVYNALDVLVLSSADEGFPNVVGEAMACGVPCIATRVGDAAALIGDTGFVVEIGDDAAIASAVSTLLREPAEACQARSHASRERIRSRFSLDALARSTEQALLALAMDSN